MWGRMKFQLNYKRPYKICPLETEVSRHRCGTTVFCERDGNQLHPPPLIKNISLTATWLICILIVRSLGSLVNRPRPRIGQFVVHLYLKELFMCRFQKAFFFFFFLSTNFASEAVTLWRPGTKPYTFTMRMLPSGCPQLGEPNPMNPAHQVL